MAEVDRSGDWADYWIGPGRAEDGRAGGVSTGGDRAAEDRSGQIPAIERQSCAVSWSAPRAPSSRFPVRWATLCLAALAVATAAFVHASQAVQAQGQVIALSAAASAEQGWTAAYVDGQGRPGRWDACQPIGYVVNPEWMPVKGHRDLTDALTRLSAATGLSFVDEGRSGEVPSLGRQAYQPQVYGERWAPLLISWVPPGRTDLGLGDGVQGVSLAVALATPQGPSIVSGQVALDADHRLPSGFGPGTTDGEVLLHELAHAVGLGHVLDPTQVMYPQTTNSESAFGAGDRAGLEAIGAAGGCHPAPAARAIRTSAL